MKNIADYFYKQQLNQLIVTVVCFLLTTSINLSAQEVPKIRIDPAQAYGGKVSDYFEQVNYIPLETTKESLFGDIQSLIITDSSFIIYDDDTRAILFFSKQGKFISKIKFKEGIYPYVSNEQEQKRLAFSLLDGTFSKSTITYYSYTGKELPGIISLKADNRNNFLFSLNNGYYLMPGSCYYTPGMKPVDSISYLLKVYKGDSLYKSFFPYNQVTNTAACAFSGWMQISKAVENGVMYVSPPFDGSIYRVTKDTVVKILQVILPLNRTAPKYIAESNDAKFVDSLRTANWPEENFIFSFGNIFLKGSFMYFKINTARYNWNPGSEAENQYNFIYDLKIARLVSFERMKPDATNGFLPFVNNWISSGGLDYNNGSFYSHISSLQLFNAKDATADKKPKYSPVMEKFFATESRKSNPVIVELKLK